MDFNKWQDVIMTYLAAKTIKRYLNIYGKSSDIGWEDGDDEGFCTDMEHFFEGLDKFEAYLQEKISNEDLKEK